MTIAFIERPQLSRFGPRAGGVGKRIRRWAEVGFSAKLCGAVPKPKAKLADGCNEDEPERKTKPEELSSGDHSGREIMERAAHFDEARL